MKAIVLGAIIAALMALSSSLTYNDAQLEHNVYCENVRSGLWPDEKNICAAIDKVK